MLQVSPKGFATFRHGAETDQTSPPTIVDQLKSSALAAEAVLKRVEKKILDSNLKECNLKSSELNTSQNPGLKKISAKRLVFVICLLRSMTCPASLHQMQR